MVDEKYQKLQDYALKLLSFRPRSIKEISDKLKRYSSKKDISVETVDQVINYLKEQDFLNDEEFAGWWLTQRKSFRPKGFQLIKLELMKKGINKETIERVFSNLKNKSEDEYASAMKVIEKKSNLFKNLHKEEKKAKIARLLATRGFSWDVIYRVIDEVLEKA